MSRIAAKAVIKRMLAGCGIEFRRVQPFDKIIDCFVWHCRDQAVESCIDVGANVGGFCKAVRNAGFDGALLAIEPRPDAHRQLAAAAAGDANWRVTAPIAVGAAAGTASFQLAANGVSSSLREMLERHFSVAPESIPSGRMNVPVSTLDEVADQHGMDAGALALKIDVQGGEDLVLDGGAAVLSRTRVLMIELSFAPLYEGAPTFSDVFARLERDGWRCVMISPVLFDATRREMLQVDGLFIRTAAQSRGT